MRVPTLAEIRKGLAALAGVAALLIAQGVLTGTAERWAEIVLSVLTVVGVYGVPNADKPVAGNGGEAGERLAAPSNVTKVGRAGYPGGDFGLQQPPTTRGNPPKGA